MDGAPSLIHRHGVGHSNLLACICHLVSVDVRNFNVTVPLSRLSTKNKRHPPAGTECERNGCPVLVNMHGTGISASDSADGFKRMEKGATEYTFGMDGGWLLARYTIPPIPPAWFI